MIYNLINTILLSLSMGTNFNNENKYEVKKNYANTDTYYQEGVEQVNWEMWKGLYYSHEEENEHIRGYEYKYRSENIETSYEPSKYLNITSKQEIRYSEINYEQAQKNEYIVRCATYNDYKIMTLQRGVNIPSYRYPYLMYTEMEVTPLNANRNMSLEYYVDESLHFPYVYTEPQNYHSGIIASVFITTEKLNSSIDYIDTIQNNQYYNTQLWTQLFDSYDEDVIDGARLTIDINLMYGSKTYIYAWFQPCYINVGNQETTLKGLLIQEDNLLYRIEQPQNTGTWESMSRDLINYQVFRGINSPIGSYEVVDIGGIMFDVLGMPFSFISTAFNLTLFPGTPYQVNISTLFLSIFAVIVFVFIVKMIIGAIGHK